MTWAAASIWIIGKIGTAVGWGYIDIAIIRRINQLGPDCLQRLEGAALIRADQS